MNYTDFIEKVEKIRMKYIEGAITPEEYFNSIVMTIVEVVPSNTEDFTPFINGRE